jgi:nucleoside-diphosphate kinase
MIEQTLILIKPDGVSKKIVGKIITRFEDMGLKIVAMKMITVDDKLTKEHYYLDEEWAKGVFEKTKASYEKEGKKLKEKTPKEMGEKIQSFLTDFIKEGPVVALVLEGPHAVELTRKVVGSTEPRSATPGTIRGDFASVESYSMADSKERAIRNLIHASDSVENAKREISLWFSADEIQSYTLPHDEHVY